MSRHVVSGLVILDADAFRADELLFSVWWLRQICGVAGLHRETQ